MPSGHISERKKTLDEKKSIIQDFKEKTVGMDFAGKLDYFWTYYKLQTIVAAFVLMVIISMASGMIKNALTTPVVNVGVDSSIDLYYDDALQDVLRQTFPESTGWNKPVLTGFYSPASTTMPYASTQLMAYLSIGELDCLIGDRATLDYCRNSELPLEFEDISDTPLGQAAKDLGIENLYYIVLTESENIEAARKFLPAAKSFQPE